VRVEGHCVGVYAVGTLPGEADTAMRLVSYVWSLTKVVLGWYMKTVARGSASITFGQQQPSALLLAIGLCLLPPIALLGCAPDKAISGGTSKPPEIFDNAYRPRPYVDACGGDDFTCGVQGNGVPLCWGGSTWGELGDEALWGYKDDTGAFTATSIMGIGSPGSFTGPGNSWVPTSVTVSSIYVGMVMPLGSVTEKVKDLACRKGHACVLLPPDGVVKCWGTSGTGSLTPKIPPTAVAGISSAISIGTGWASSCAVIASDPSKQVGSVKCWGSNLSFALGNTDTSDAGQTVPVEVGGISTAVMVSPGGSHTCALLENGDVMCWGSNESGQLATGSKVPSVNSVPQRVGVSNATWLASGQNHVCAATSDGSVWCWGYNGYGQLGNGLSGPGILAYTPGKVSSLKPVRTGTHSIAAGAVHTCAVHSDGTVSCWGYDEYGQTGDPSNFMLGGTTTVPHQVAGISTAVKVIAGDYHTCALLNDMTMKCWGYALAGQLGEYRVENTAVPIP